MNKWSNRLSKVLAAAAGGFRYLPMQGVRGKRIRIPLAAHRRYHPGPMADAELVEFLADALPENGVFLDIGANIGTYSAAIGVAKRGKIHGAAFEPVPTTNALLRRTLALNGLAGIRAEPIALSSAAVELRLTGYGGGGNNAIVSDGDDRAQVRTRSETLDAWVAAHPELAPNAVKIDVEGHELEVLRGARNVLRRYRPSLVVECHCASWPALGVRAAEVDALLRECGYAALLDRRGAPLDLGACTKTVHVLCRPAAA